MPGGFPLGPELCGAADIGTVTGSSRGTAVAIGNNTPGSWVQLSASTPSDCCMMLVSIGPPSGSSFSSAIDIGVGTSGNEKVIHQQLMASGSTNITGTQVYLLPCDIPAGSRVAARGQGNPSDTAYVNIILFDGAFTQMEGAAGSDSIGFVGASTTGTAVTPSATANTKGSYAQLTAATAKDYIGFIASIVNNGASLTNDDYLVDIAIGGSGSEVVIVPNLHITPGGFIQSPGNVGPLMIPIPAGTRIAARCQASGASATAIGLVLYGIYE